jgi:Carboxypeptidase regulatory-like domain
MSVLPTIRPSELRLLGSNQTGVKWLTFFNINKEIPVEQKIGSPFWRCLRVKPIFTKFSINHYGHWEQKMRSTAFWLLLFVFPVISITVFAQNAISTGSISGRVTDPTGAVVIGATVTAESVAAGVKPTTKTNGTGFYSFPSLSVGAYNISVSQAGFKTAIIDNVLVEVGQNTAGNATLQVGNLTESVSITGEAPLIRTTESTASTVVNENLIENLPLSGRRYTDFVLLTPNANADGDFGLVSMAGQQGGADSGYANGNGSNSFTVDGANATSNYFGEARGRTRVPYVAVP